MAGPEPVRVRWNGGDRTFAPGTHVTIGRDHGETIRLSDDRVSRHHAELRSTPDGWLLVDLGSTSGTFVGAERITQLLLRSRTSLRFGGLTSSDEVVFEVGTPLPAPAAPTEIARPMPLEPTVLPTGRVERPGGVLSPNAAAGATEVAGAQLQVQFAGQSRVLNPGDTLRLGREAGSADLVTDNPTVSREHARLSYQGDGWYIDDPGSTRGTFRDGRKITHEKIVGTEVFVLGPPESGERLVVVAAGTAKLSVRRRLRQPKNLVFLAVAALVIAGLALAGVVIFSGDDAPKVVSVAYMRARTVRLSSEIGSGTGSIIDGERGLILTNAHVVSPDAPGQGVNYPYKLSIADGQPNFVLPEAPKEIVVSLTGEADEAAEPRYIAEVVAVDGYLDLAVIQITKKIGGTRIEEGEDLGLPEVSIGDSLAVDQDEKITVIGFPGVADSESPLVTDGRVSGFKGEDRLDENRAWINSSVSIGAGNSGGPAYNEAGQLIAVVTAKRTLGNDQISRIRPIHLATALIAAARDGDAYVSPFVTPAKDEKIVGREGQDPKTDATLHFATTGDQTFSTSCRNRGVDALQSTDVLSMLFAYDGFPQGHQDVLVSVYSPLAGEDPVQIASNDVWPLKFGEHGCLAFSVPLDWSLQPGQTYLVSVDVGPNYEKNLIETNLTI